MGDERMVLSNTGVSIEPESIPGGFMLYYADGDEEVIHVNQHTLDLLECSTVDEFMELTGGTFKGFVHEDDIDGVEESIWQQVSAKGGYDHVFYRVRTRTGNIISIDDYGKLIEAPGKRPMFTVFLAIVDRYDTRDWLTGLPELAHFKHLAEIQTKDYSEGDAVPTILAFDLMGMKNYNATYGRGGGDVLLRAFADVLRLFFDGDACCRHAGDRFFVFTKEEGLDEKVDAVFKAFADSGVEGVLPVMGGACSFYPGDDVSTVLDRARLACDTDSVTWQSHMTWFTDGMRSEATLRAYVLDHLDQAIANRWLRPYYQAIMRSSTKCACCEEALARWVDPEHGVLSPGLFIPVLERAGLLQKLDMHMVDCILEDFKTKRENGTPIVPVSVNISLRDLGMLDVTQEIVRRADEAGIPHDFLRIEFTESAASEDPEHLMAQIDALHEAGFEVWMDDFGSGYSSLNTIGTFPFDLIKLDMELIRDIDNPRARDIIAGTIKVSALQGVRTLAEGVETEEQAAFLTEAGCGMLQGYLFAKPTPLETICQRAEEGRGLPREDVTEHGYWDVVALFDLNNPIAQDEGQSSDSALLAGPPAAVVEHRDGHWRLVRMNDGYREFLLQNGVIRPEGETREGFQIPLHEPDRDFANALKKSKASGEWERIAGRFEYGTGLQFYTKPIASATGVDAYAIASIPAMIGTTLGSYGDVPVAYAVFRAVLDDAGEQAVDAEFVYANDQYCEAVGVRQSEVPGRVFSEVVGKFNLPWLPAIYRAAIGREKQHGVVYGPVIDHWISYNIAPSPVDGCCVFAYTVVDDARREREEMIKGRETADRIIDIVGAFDEEIDYDSAMNGVLAAMGEVIHSERLYIFERGETTSDNTFEWCAPGIEPQIDTLQNLDNSEFDTWEEMLASNPAVDIPDVDALKGVDDRMYWQLSRQGITRMIAVPLYGNGELLGYLGADNYMPLERLDTSRLLLSAAKFIGTRIIIQRLLS